MRIIVLIFLLIQVVKSGDILPMVVKTYELDDVQKCGENNGIFCKVSVTLTPYNNTFDSRAWKIVKETSEDFRYFDRTKLLHGRCFEKNQQRSLSKILQEDYKTRYLNESLQGIVNTFRCFEKGRLILNDVDYWDLAFILFAVMYFLFLFAATIYTSLVEHQKDKMLIKILTLFSFRTTWKDLIKPILNEDFQKLKSVQGLRTLTMMLIVSMHAFYGNMFNFLNNPEYVENIFHNTITRCLATILFFLVQVFFIISAWLLTIQLCGILKKNGELTLKDISLLAMNRYFRLLPMVAVVLMATRSNLTFDVISYLNEDIAEREVNVCREDWWKNILFIQNFYESRKICTGTTWYLATDYHLYILTLVLFYVSHKLKIPRKYLIGLTMITAIAIQVGIIENTNFQGILRLIPKTANLQDMMVSDPFIWSYIPIWCNSVTYMIGVIFGVIYYNHKQEKLFTKINEQVCWFLSFFGFPMLALLIASYQYKTRIFELLVSVIARPLFGTGIAIGILGMATGTGGPIRAFLEIRPLVFLANFCYCVYLSHYAIIFIRILLVDEAVDLSLYYIAKYTLIDYTLSFSLGAILYMAVEHPFIQLQKLFLPQVKTKKSNTDTAPKQVKSTNLPSA